MTTTEGILMYNGLHTVKNGSDLLPIQGKGALSHLYLLYDGSIYNHKQLCLRLHSHNIRTEELTPPEILLSLYHLYGDAFAGLLRGCFAMAILDTRARQLTLYRDPMGIRPLFYYKQQDLFLFASEIKGLLAHPQVSAATDLRGLHQIFSLGPAHLPGTTIYQGISEVRPGCSLTYGNGCIREARFWSLQARRHEESYEDTIDHAGYLLKNAIQQQYHRQASTCCLLSGGLDSSLVTAMVHVQKPAGYPLATYSFDFADSSRFFSANSFQPSLPVYLPSPFWLMTVLPWPIFLPRCYTFATRYPENTKWHLPENVQMKYSAVIPGIITGWHRHRPDSPGRRICLPGNCCYGTIF
jgi:asparagine synthase (glutamine-hydrolysing)